MPTCLRCGQCCYIKNKDDKITKKKCRFLVILKSGKTLCRIYNNRLGTMITKENVCILRENDKRNYPGCPYNKKEYEVKDGKP